MVNRIRRSMADKDQGFTLIELLVVIIIIGILAAIAIPVFLNQRKKGVDASLKSDLKNAATLVETWIVDNPGTPVVSSGWISDGAAATGALSGLKLSPGTIMGIGPVYPAGDPGLGSPGGYCLQAYNPNASQAYTGGTFRMGYKSLEGGLQPNSISSC